MANQVIVTNTGNVQVALTPPPNVQVQISRAAIGTVSNVPTANFANYAANVTASNQPNITNVGTLGNLSVSGSGTIGNLVVTGNLQVGNLVANTANYANFAGQVVDATQSNITSIGTLTGLSIAGNIIPTSNVTYDLGNNTNRFNDLYLAGNTIYIGAQEINANATGVSFTGNLTGDGSGLSNVAGANITGVVANANYSAYANIAATANSVAVANVSGIGNIAVINLDGNASNVLFGNGVFGPESGNLNANYANFAGEAFNVNASNITGTVANANYSAYAGEANTANLATFATTANAVAGANVSGTVANATFALDAGNANIANLATYATTANSVAGANVSGTVANATFALDAGNSNLANTANSVALANVVGIGNIANINLDGNASNILFGNGTFSAIPVVNNVANANYANFAGTAFSVSGSNVSGEVANANFASYANLASTANLATFATTANSVAGANVSGEVANANYSSYANIAATANSVAVGNVSGIGNIAVINLDGSSSNVLFGNGVFAPESTSIANANYANFAGTVITNAQPNITSVGNLPYLQVSNSANATGVVNQLASNNITFASNFTNVVSYKITTEYHPNASTGYPAERIVRSRGNVTNPTTGVSGDRVFQKASYVYNGNTNVVTALETVAVAGTVNANANAAYTGGQWTLNTGNPQGDTGNILSITGQNALLFNNAGGLSITPGTVPNTSLSQSTTQLFIQGYGQDTTNLAATNTITVQRARGNRDSVQSVQPGDQLGQIAFNAYNGSAYTGTKGVSFRAEVANSYTTGNAIVPLQFTVRTIDTANTSIFTTILSNGGLMQHSNAVLQSNASGNLSFGLNAANTTQGANSIAFGNNAGFSNQGANSIAIGAGAGVTNQANNNIILNATGSNLDFTTANSFVVKPIRNTITGNAVFYDSSSGEISYDTLANNTSNVSAANVTINSNGFMKLASYTEAALTAITGQIGWMAAVSDSSGGGNPNGMIAFWDTTNTRWSYIHDNSAV